MQQPSGDLGEALLVASRGLVGVAARSLADADEVTLPQFRALVLLASRERVTVSDLADALGVHPTTATRLCDRLVRKRLVRRAAAVEDRRETEVHLTPSGRRLVERVTERRRRDLAAIAARMADVDVAAAIEALEAFGAAADGVDPGSDLFGWQVHG